MIDFEGLRKKGIGAALSFVGGIFSMTLFDIDAKRFIIGTSYRGYSNTGRRLKHMLEGIPGCSSLEEVEDKHHLQDVLILGGNNTDILIYIESSAIYTMGIRTFKNCEAVEMDSVEDDTLEGVINKFNSIKDKYKEK